MPDQALGGLLSPGKDSQDSNLIATPETPFRCVRRVNRHGSFVVDAYQNLKHIPLMYEPVQFGISADEVIKAFTHSTPIDFHNAGNTKMFLQNRRYSD